MSEAVENVKRGLRQITSYALHLVAILGHIAILIALVYQDQLIKELKENVNIWVYYGIVTTPFIIDSISLYMR